MDATGKPLPESDDDEEEEPGDPFALATMPRRVLAFVVDVLLLASILGAVHAAIFHFVFAGERPAFTHVGWQLECYALATISLPVWLYFARCESGPYQATLGKRLVGLKVSGLDGERLEFGTAFARTILKLVPWEMTHMALFMPTPVWDAPNDALMRPPFMLSTFLVGSWFVTAFLTPNQQAPHDLLVKSVVVRGPHNT